MGTHSQMALRGKALDGLAARYVLPLQWWLRVGRLRSHVQLKQVKSLQHADEHEGRFVVRKLRLESATKYTALPKNSYLLAKADAWSRVEGQEDERIGREVFLKPFVKEPVGVEFHCCDVRLGIRMPEAQRAEHLPS